MKVSKTQLKKMIKEAVDKKLLEYFTTEQEDEKDMKVMTWGEIPSPEELRDLMDGESFDMLLKGADSLAWDYAMKISTDPQAGSEAPGEGMHATITALVDAPEPDELSDEKYEEVESVLDEWNERYSDISIAETAWSLASSIMQSLNVEWI